LQQHIASKKLAFLKEHHKKGKIRKGQEERLWLLIIIQLRDEKCLWMTRKAWR